MNHTTTYNFKLTPKKCTKKDGLLVSMEDTGLSHDIFFKFSLGPFEVIEVELHLRLNFDHFFFENFQSGLKV